MNAVHAAGRHSTQVSAPMDMTLAGLHTAAQARLARHPAGAAFQATRYQPLAQLVNQGEQLGGEWRVIAMAACQDVLAADDVAVARMLRDGRVSPNARTGPELVEARVAAHRAIVTPHRPRVSLAEQLSAMEGRGFRFTVDGSELRVHAPGGLMSDADRDIIRTNKAAIVAHMHASSEVF